jgi:LAT3 family solute carrier family 43 protein 3
MKSAEHDKPPSALEQMKSAEHILLTPWLSTPQYFVGSIGFQLEEKGDDDGFYNFLFSITYAAGIVVAPVGGYMADNLGLGITQGVATLLCAFSLFVHPTAIP